MLSQRVKDFIAEQSFCSEYLFKDWESFLKLVYADGGHITAILWWDYCKKSEQCLSVGGGGYSDSKAPAYMYAETSLFESGMETKTLDEIREHIIEVKKAGLQYGNNYISHELVPSFYLDE